MHAQSSSPTRVQLLDLPNELLLDIFEKYDLSIELYHLGLTCKRLNRLALLTFLTKQGIHHPASEVSLRLLDKEARLTLSALRRLLALKSVAKLSCVFPHRPRPPFYPLEELRLFCDFVEKLDQVEEVNLVLDDRGRYCGITGSDDALREWSGVMERLLNALVERSCVSLTFQNGYVLTHAYELRPTSRSPSPPSLPYTTHLDQDDPAWEPDSALRLPGWEFYRPIEQGTDRVLTRMTRPSHIPCILREFHIYSPILLLPPCSNWTLSALQCPSVTRLTLSHVVLSPDVWSAMLPCIFGIVQDRLLELKITNCRTIPAEGILECLARLRRLQVLVLDCQLPCLPAEAHPDGDPHASAPSIVECIAHFEDLRTLEAPSDYVNHLLLAEDGLSRLEKVCVYPRTTLSPAFRMVKSASILSPILSRLDHCPNVELNLHMEVPCTPSMIRDTQILSHLALTPNSASSSALKSLYGRVKTITLDDFYVLFDSAEVLCRWIALFGNVEVVRLAWPLTESVWMKNGRELEESIEVLLQTCRALCASLRSVVLDGREYLL
ncbi:hypothetical protein AX16_009691 [Volvariella volvacea WC 439]|nr:hypothetical protein AX16_009691 [Volvariella volvacea WC 439]